MHSSPSVAHEPPGPVHAPPVQTLLQHCALDVQAPASTVHLEAVEQVRVCGLQSMEQHSLDSAHAVPAGLHWFGPLHRSAPSTS